MALFELDLNQRQENFVRKCFGSDNERYGAFVDPDVEAELDRLAQSPTCDLTAISYLMAPFHKGLEGAVGTSGRMTEVLNKYADPEDFDKWNDFIFHSCQAMFDIISHMHDRHQISCIYPRISHLGRGEKTLLLVCQFGIQRRVFYFDGRVMRAAEPRDLLAALFYTWFKSGYNMVQARKLIIDTCRKRVALIRAHAESEFGSAVACSADGSKIIKADEVWVLEPRTDMTAVRVTMKIPGSRFVFNKALRPAEELNRVGKGILNAEIRSNRIAYDVRHFLGKIDGRQIYGLIRQCCPPSILRAHEQA